MVFSNFTLFLLFYILRFLSFVCFFFLLIDLGSLFCWGWFLFIVGVVVVFIPQRDLFGIENIARSQTTHAAVHVMNLWPSIAQRHIILLPSTSKLLRILLEDSSSKHARNWYSITSSLVWTPDRYCAGIFLALGFLLPSAPLGSGLILISSQLFTMFALPWSFIFCMFSANVNPFKSSKKTILSWVKENTAGSLGMTTWYRYGIVSLSHPSNMAWNPFRGKTVRSFNMISLILWHNCTLIYCCIAYLYTHPHSLKHDLKFIVFR